MVGRSGFCRVWQNGHMYNFFTCIRHREKNEKNDKMRFREKKRKKYNRRKDRFFLNRSNKAKMLAYLPQTGIITIDEFHFNNEIGGYHVTICYDKK